MKAGNIIRVPKGTTRKKGYGDGPASKTRKEIVAAVQFDLGDAELYFEDVRKQGWVVREADVELLDSGHHLCTVDRQALGEHAIKGWNWPIYGYTYRCSCGFKGIDREDYAAHLRAVAESSRDERAVLVD